MKRRLEGKVAVVTGGGQGLGRALSETLAQQGATVAVCDVRAELAEEAVISIVSDGGTAAAYQLDVSDPLSVERTTELIREAHVHVDYLINNAGVDVTKPVETLTVEEWDNVVAINLRGPFLMSSALLADIQARQGHIINIVSTAAKRAWTEASAYHASKWGLLGYSHALHAELRRDGVKVTAAILGGMRTPFIMERFPEVDASTLQDPHQAATVVCSLFSLPPEVVVPEIMVLPMKETSWP